MTGLIWKPQKLYEIQIRKKNEWMNERMTENHETNLWRRDSTIEGMWDLRAIKAISQLTMKQ